MRGPCPVTGAGSRGAWFEPGRTAAVVGGCHKCDESFEAHLSAVRGDPARDVAPQHATGERPAAPPSDLPARLWRAAAAPEQTPGARYVVERRQAWPAGERFPASVRWLPGDVAREVGITPRLPPGAAGGVVYLFAGPGDVDTCSGAPSGSGRHSTACKPSSKRGGTENDRAMRPGVIGTSPSTAGDGCFARPAIRTWRSMCARDQSTRCRSCTWNGSARWQLRRRRGAWHERRGAVPAGGVSGPGAGDDLARQRSTRTGTGRGGEAVWCARVGGPARDDPTRAVVVRRLERLGAGHPRGPRRTQGHPT